jgi:hypothetical protein
LSNSAKNFGWLSEKPSTPVMLLGGEELGPVEVRRGLVGFLDADPVVLVLGLRPSIGVSEAPRGASRLASTSAACCLAAAASTPPSTSMRSTCATKASRFSL